MSFTHDDVQRLLQLLDSSHFDEMHLETEGIKLTLRRGGAPSPLLPAGTLSASDTPGALPTSSRALPPADRVAALAPSPVVSIDAEVFEVKAPMLGTFYGAPKPGAAPFVTVGDRVDANSAIGIIEVMKLMNSISATVDGVVIELLARDGDLVEFDQVLMRVRRA